MCPNAQPNTSSFIACDVLPAHTNCIEQKTDAGFLECPENAATLGVQYFDQAIVGYTLDSWRVHPLVVFNGALPWDALQREVSTPGFKV